MKIAVLSDIHSNAIALRSALDDIAARGCDALCALGDYIGESAQPDVALDMLAERPDARIIAGNRERVILEYRRGLRPELDAYEQYASLIWNDRRLQPRHIDAIAHMPAEIRWDVDGTSILMNHGMASEVAVQAGYDPLDREGLRRIGLFSDDGPDDHGDVARDVLAHMTCDIYLCGHSHIPGIHAGGGRLWVNPGSVSNPIYVPPGVGTYAMLAIEGGSSRAEIVTFAKDLDAIERTNDALGYTAAGGMFAKLGGLEIRTGRPHSMWFLRHASRLSHEAGHPSGPIPNDVWREAIRTWERSDECRVSTSLHDAVRLQPQPIQHLQPFRLFSHIRCDRP